MLADSRFLKYNQDFEMFGNQHMIALLCFLLFGIVLIKWAKNITTQKQNLVGTIFAFSLSITIIIWTFLKIYLNGFDIKEDLPIHLCNLIALFLPIFSITKNKTIYEIIFFWIFAGTSHSVITPDLVNGFPNFIFFKYWYVHAGLIIFICYATIVYGFKPNLKSVFKSFLALQVYIAFMFLINSLTEANYFYTNFKPIGRSALDYLGEWPTYIFVAELIMVPYFLLFLLPFQFLGKKNLPRLFSK